MSFRSRLYLLVLVTGLLPIVAAAVVAYGRGDREADVAAGRLDHARTVVAGAYERASAESGTIAARVQEDPRLPGYLASRGETARRLLRAIAREHGAVIVDLDRSTRSGARDPIASAILRIDGPSRRRLRIASQSVNRFVEDAARMSGASVGIALRGATIASSTGETPSAGEDPGDGESVTRVRVREGWISIGMRDDPAPGLVERVEGEPLLWGALVGLLLVGGTLLALTVSLTGDQLRRMRVAATGIREGRYDTRVEVIGHDDLAGLGEEFNAMGEALQGRDERLRVEHERLQRSWKGVGELLSGTLDEASILPAVAGVLREVGEADWLLVTADDASAAIGEADDEAVRAVAEAMAATTDPPGRGGDVRVEAVEHGHVVVLAGTPRIALGMVGAEEVSETLVTVLRQARVSIDNARLHARVERDARVDALTGLANRRASWEAIAAEIDRSERYGHALSLLLFDLDDFKRVNDVHGHAQGDEVLRVVARVLRGASRTVDVPGRWGGEEFVVVLPEADLDAACVVAERIARDLRATSLTGPDSSPIAITASIGVVTAAGEDVDALVARADAALYAAKEAGKDRVVVG